MESTTRTNGHDSTSFRNEKKQENKLSINDVPAETFSYNAALLGLAGSNDQAPAQMKPEEEPSSAEATAGRELQMKPEEDEVQLKQREPALIQHKSDRDDEKKTQLKAGGTYPHLSGAITTQAKMPEEVQAKMEQSFGTDFSDVNVHKDSSSAKDMGALAYAQGNDVHFAPGQYNPESQKGQELLGHELTHVVQQRQGRVNPTVQGKGMSVNDDSSLEKEADLMGAKAAQGKSVSPSLSAGKNSVQKKGVIQKQDPVSIAGLGLAVFMSGREIVTSGSFSSKTNHPSYMHEGTPENATWDKVKKEVVVSAWHPRYGFGYQHFHFMLMYEYNGYDIRAAKIEPLMSKSSSMIMSTFDISWDGQAYSRPSDDVSQIIFHISGQWDPVGRGHVGFYGDMVISAAKNGKNYERFGITSDKWVHAGKY